MSRLGICFEDVEKTAESILTQGENPTIEKIRRILGTGSNSTIAKFLHEWRSHRLIASTHHLVASPPPDPVNLAVNQVWEKIRNESAAEIKAYQEKADIEIKRMENERDESVSAYTHINQEYELSQKRFNQLAAEKELLTLDFKKLQQEHDLLKNKNQHLLDQYEAFKQQANDKISILENINQNEIETRKTTIADLKETHDKLLNQLVETHENFRQQAIADIDHYKIEQQKQKKIIEDIKFNLQNTKIELAESKDKIKLITLERDYAISDSQTKDKINEYYSQHNKKIESILKEVEYLKNIENKNKLSLILPQLHQATNNLELMVKTILTTLADNAGKTEVA
jgi:DNA repair exonuclease SbcCD ATPase subunit